MNEQSHINTYKIDNSLPDYAFYIVSLWLTSHTPFCDGMFAIKPSSPCKLQPVVTLNGCSLP